MGKSPGTRKPPGSSFLDKLAKKLDATPVVYATSNRKPLNLFAGNVSNDALAPLGEHLDRIRQVQRLALVLHTNGGSVDVPWPFVNLLRRHAQEVVVVVPEYALSAGTLIALGADRVIMNPHAFLSPVDPTGSFEIDGKTKRVSVEDVLGYVDFITRRAGIQDQASLIQALSKLTEEVGATVLGNIHRTRSLIERLSRNLLELHMRSIDDRKRVDQIVDYLTHSLFTHQHLISPQEARDVIGLGEMVEEAKPGQASAIAAAHRHILKELKCREPFDPEKELNKASKDKPVEIPYKRAILVSQSCEHAFADKLRISRKPDGNIEVRTLSGAAWRKTKPSSAS